MNADANNKKDGGEAGAGTAAGAAGDSGRASENSSPPAGASPAPLAPTTATAAGPIVPLASAVARTNWWSALAPGHRALAIIAVLGRFVGLGNFLYQAPSRR